MIRRVLLGLVLTAAAAWGAAPSIASVTNGGNFDTRIAIGGDIAVFGSGLTGTNVSITVGGTAGFIAFKSATQVNAQVPWTASTGSAAVILTVDGVASNTVNINLTALAPAFLQSNTFQHASNSTQITAASPATPGETVVGYLVGMGPTTPAAPLGITPAPPPLYTTTNTATMTVGGSPATIPFAGLNPSFAGLYQVTFVVPGVAQASQPVILTIGGQPSNTASLFVGPTPPITYTGSTNFAVLLGPNQQGLTPAGGTGSYTASVITGSMPPGMELRTTNLPAGFTAPIGFVGVATTPGTYNFTVRFTSGAATLDVAMVATTGTAGDESPAVLPDVVSGAAYSYQLTAASLLPSPSYSWTIFNGQQMPPGLSLSSSGLITGTLTAGGPTAPAAGSTYSFQFGVTDGPGNVPYFSYPHTITVRAYSISTAAALPVATQGVAYNNQLSTSGASGSVTWTKTFDNISPGLTLSSSGLLSGTPVSTNTNRFAVVTTDAAGKTNQKTFDLNVLGSPSVSILSPAGPFNQLPDAPLGTYQTYELWAFAGTEPYTFALHTGSQLPPGMSLQQGASLPNLITASPREAMIVGLPTTIGTYSFQVDMTDSSSPAVTVSRSFTLKVAALSNNNFATATQGTAYSSQLFVEGGTSPYTVSVLAGGHVSFVPEGLIGVPPGMTLSSSGVLTGTPTSSGTFWLPLVMTDASNVTLTRPVTITINSSSPSTPMSFCLNPLLPSASLTKAYSTTLCAAGGTGASTWSVQSGSLPGGLVLAAGTGVISGTPNTAGANSFVVRATDTASHYVQVQVSLDVTTLFASQNGALPFGNVGAAYSQQLTVGASDGSTQMSLEVDSILPPGLTLSSAGLLSGTPSSAGQYFFNIRFTTTLGAGGFVVQNYSLAVYPVGGAPTLVWTTGPNYGTISTGPAKFVLTASGGRGPYTFSFAAANSLTGFRVQNGQPLPANFTASQTAGLMGVALTAGTPTFTLRVTDADGRTADQSATLTITGVGPGMINNLPYGTSGQTYTQQLTASGGTPPYTWAQNGTMPTGITVSPAGVLTGPTPTAGLYAVPLKVTDANNSVGFFNYFLPAQALRINWPGKPGPLPNATVGVFYSQTLTASFGTGSYTWSLNQNTLPNGFTLNASTGLISGTTTGYGNFSFQLKVTDGTSTSFQWIQLSVIPAGPVAPAITNSSASFTSFTAGVYNFPTAINIVGGAAPYTITADTTLPAGMSLAQTPPGRDVIVGFWYLQGRQTTPGTYPVTFRVTDSFNNTATASYNLVVTAMSLDTTSLPDRGSLTFGTPFSQALLVLGGSGSYTFANSQPLLSGMSLNAGGTVSGTPTSTGAVTSLLSITDANDATSKLLPNFTLTAGSSSTVTLNINNGTDFGTLAQGSIFTNTLNASGSPLGTPAYVWTLEPGSTLPSGISILSGSTLPNGFTPPTVLLGGFAYTPGNYTFTLRVTDASGNFGIKVMTIHFSGETLLGTTGLPIAPVGVLYTIQLYSANTTGTLSYALAAGSSAPPGLSLSFTGLLTGTPTTPGLYPFTVLIGDGVTPALTRTFSLRETGINITSPEITQFIANVPQTFSFTQTGAVGATTWSWTLSNPFCGLTLNSSTGAVTGTPTSCVQNTSFTVTVTDSTGMSNSQQATFSSSFPFSVVTINPGFLVDATVGSNTNYSGGANGGRAPFTFALASGSSLPPGMQLAATSATLKSLNSGFLPNTFKIFGVPTTPGTYTFTLNATDSSATPLTAAMTYTITVSSIAVEQSGPRPGLYNTAYSQQLTGYSPNGPVTCSLAYGYLPSGVTLTGCLLSGTPTDTGNFTLGIQFADGSALPLVSRQFLTINAAANPNNNPTVNLTTAYPSDGGVGTLSAARTFNAAVNSPGTAPFTFTLVSGSQIPIGMTFGSLSPTVALTQQPTTPGLYQYTINAMDSAPSQNFGQRTFRFNISPMQWSLGTFFVQQIARVGQPFTFTLPIAGGTPPYTYSVVRPGTDLSSFSNSPLPPGLSLSNGQITGTPLGTGIFLPNIRATDSLGATYDFRPTFNVYPAGAFVDQVVGATKTINASVGVPMSFPLDSNPLQGGGYWYLAANAPVTWTLHSGSVLPAGVSLVSGSPNYLAGTPTTAGTYTFSIDMNDASVPSGGQPLTVAVTLIVPAINVTPGILPGATAGTPYTANLSVSGGTAPYGFTSVTSPGNSLPPGLSISAAGAITGTPIYAGRFAGTIVATDSATPTANTFNKNFTLMVGGAGTVVPLLTAAPQTLQVSYQQGNPAPGPVPLSVGSSTGGPITFTTGASTLQGGNWLSVSAAGGTAPASLTLTLSPGSLAPGTYNGLATLTGSLPDNGTVPVNVTLTVSAAAPCSYSIAPGSGSISAGGGTLNIGVTASAATCAWVASTPAAWVTFPGGGGGTGNGTVVVNAAANNVGNTSQRTATVTIAGQPYTLTQFGQACSFTLTPTSASLPAGGGGVQTSLSASASTCPWTAQTNSAAMLTIDAGLPTSGTGSSSFTMTVSANGAASPRSGTLTIGGQTFTVTQDGINCTTTLGLNSTELSYTGGAVTIPVTATCGFNITPGPNWITVSGTTASSVNLSVAPNSSTQSRSGTIQIGGLGFQVIEDAVPCSFSLGNNSPVISSGGGNGTISITASDTTCGWVASSNASFVGISSAPSGTGSGTLSFSVGANSAQTGRTGTISIAGQNVTVQQGGLLCAYGLQSTAATVNGLGGTGIASVITSPGCTYGASSNAPWINLTSGTTGSGSGNVGFTAAANGAATGRSGTITVAGQTFTVTETGMPCTYTLGTSSAALSTAGGIGSFTFTTATTGCSPNVQSYAGWLGATVTFNPANGQGSVNYVAQLNPTPYLRTGTISVEDQTFTVAVAASACSYALGTTGASYGRTGGTGFVQFNASPPGCVPLVTAPGAITLLGTTSDAVSGQDVNYNVAPYQVYVNWVRIMQINIAGNLFTVKQTSW